MNIDPRELKGYILGLTQAKLIAKRYVGIDMVNYIGELDDLSKLMEEVRLIVLYLSEMPDHYEEKQMNKLSDFTSEELMKLIYFYASAPKLRLIEVIIECMPKDKLDEVLNAKVCG